MNFTFVNSTITATIAATSSIAISTLSFFSMNSAMAATTVITIGRCDAFNNAGVVIGKTIPGRKYQLVTHIKFRNGLNGAKIIGKYTSFNRQRLVSVNVLNDCLRTVNNRVIKFN